METLFKRYFWAIQLTVVVLSALLIGAGLSRLVFAKLAPYGIAVPDEGMKLSGDQKRKEKPLIGSISEVGFAQPETPETVDLCEGVTCEDGEVCNRETGQCDPEGADEDDLDDPDAGPCYDTELQINLAGTMVSPEADWSVAILHDPTKKKTVFARVGDKLLSQAEVTSISRNRVMIVRDGQIECLRPESVRQAAKDRPKPKPRKVGGANANTDNASDVDTSDLNKLADEAVKNRGNNQYEIQKDALDAVLKDQQKLREQAPTVAPFYRDGKPAGFRLNGVRSDSIFSSLGIRNGDVITSVNGQTIDSPQRAMQLYEGLSQRGTIKMIIERGGRPVTITYDIQ